MTFLSLGVNSSQTVRPVPTYKLITANPAHSSFLIVITPNLSPSGAVYLFSGNSYWKFTSPGSASQDGYPRSIAEDWLDCPDILPSSPFGDDLSLSPPAGRQELRERRREDRGSEREQTGAHIWTHCTCQNGASFQRTKDWMAVAFLCVWTLSAF